MFEQNRSQYYSYLKNMINQHDQDLYIGKCIQFINKLKEHRHSKIKNKHISKFKHLYFKRFGYHHNFTRNSQFLNNTDCALSGQSNVPSSFLPLCPVPAVIHQFLPHPWPLHLHLAWTQHPQYPQHPQQHPDTNPPVPGMHVKQMIIPKRG